MSKVSIPLVHFKLSKQQSLTSGKDRVETENAPYSLAVGSLMYETICTRLGIEFPVGVVTFFLSDPGKEHREGVK